MRRALVILVTALMAAAFLAEGAAARDGLRRPRIVVHPSPRYAPEPGTIYGYAPGSYVLGRSGVLYGPYPLNPNARVQMLRY